MSLVLSTDWFSIYLSRELSVKKKIGKSPELECYIAGEARPTHRSNPTYADRRRPDTDAGCVVRALVIVVVIYWARETIFSDTPE